MCMSVYMTVERRPAAAAAGRRVAARLRRCCCIVNVTLFSRVTCNYKAAIDIGPWLFFCMSTFYVLLMCYKSSAVAEMGDRLATKDTGRKVGGLLCLFP